MQHRKIYARRIQRFIDLVHGMRYSDASPLQASFVYHGDTPIPYEEALGARYKPIAVGEIWGHLWGCSWFKFEGRIPPPLAGKEVIALIDIDGEGCVFVNGTPNRGMTHKAQGGNLSIKRRVPVGNPAEENQPVSILVEGGANELFGSNPVGHPFGDSFRLRQAELVVFHRDLWNLGLDMMVLMELASELPGNSPRAQKILRGLNDAANAWNGGAGIIECKKITEKLLSVRANASDMTVWSIGHAHMDLGWKWPIRETRRKAGRTFSTALRMMEEYPEYKFGASQPQLYEWVKEDYPDLYAEVGQAVKKGAWELQGAMWVEPDMNVTGGESLVRQCLYGKTFYLEEFGKDVRNLWLPDVFGYSAALPQILKKAGVDVFMTQKISWNETNTFPHHTFNWEGIDGTAILTHFLPTNDYNLENSPRQLIGAQERFAQSDVQDGFLNLFGIGDGGGGPSRMHIEYGRRLQDTEGSPKIRFVFAEEFFKEIAKTPSSELPNWAGELYLELHRGTLTTQGLMKRHNRLLELKLRDVEILAVLAETWDKNELDRIWKDTLLNQFHDILPGSSIAWVYADAHALSKKNLGLLGKMQEEALGKLFGGVKSGSASSFMLMNTLSWKTRGIIALPAPSSAGCVATDSNGQEVASCRDGDTVFVQAEVPSLGHTGIRLGKGTPARITGGVACSETGMWNTAVRIRLAKDGTVSSIHDNQTGREALSGSANKLLLWEDIPYEWDAWDVSHYYRETTPEQARLVSRRVVLDTPLRCTIEQRLEVGSSSVTQLISLERDSRVVTFKNTVDWREENKILKVHAETSVLARNATYEIQYGQIERPTHRNTSWDDARFEVAGQRYADLSQSDFGFALLNDCKYGYSVYGNSIELSLLRSPKSPDPEADMAVHEFTYAYMPHAGSLAGSGVFQAAHELNTPVLVRGVSSMPEFPLKSWYEVHGENVKIEAVKQAESGQGTILRLYETAGTSAEVELTAETGWKGMVETDLMEKPLGKPLGAGHSIRLAFGPYEIKTLLLE